MSKSNNNGYLTLSDMFLEVEGLTQENDDNDVWITYINKAINRINIECRTKFPLVSQAVVNNDYEPLIQPWTDLIVLYVCYEIKRANELPLFDEFYNQWKELLSAFLANADYLIEEKYRLPYFGKGKIQQNDWSTQFGDLNANWDIIDIILENK